MRAARLDPGALRPAPGCRDKPQSVVVARLAPKKRRSCAQTISRKWNPAPQIPGLLLFYDTVILAVGLRQPSKGPEKLSVDLAAFEGAARPAGVAAAPSSVVSLIEESGHGKTCWITAKTSSEEAEKWVDRVGPHCSGAILDLCGQGRRDCRANLELCA